MRIWSKYAGIFAAAIIAVSGAVCADTGETKAAEYLSEYYNVEPFSIDEDTDADAVNAVLTALGGKAIEGEFSNEAVIAEGIRLAGMEELALSYENEADPDKAKEVLEREGVTAEHEEYAPYIACALDLGLIESGAEGKTDPEEFLYRCMEIGGKGRHYVGRIQDENILSEMQTVMNEFVLFNNEQLTELGNLLVLGGTTTGYNLQYNKYRANFLADYTIMYGHDSFQHAVQLIGLLKSEGMDGYIQVKPKASVYEYMPEWGEPSEPTPTYAVREAAGGRYLCFAVEYDMEIEFDTKEEKEAFHQLIEDYAKKYDDRVDEDGNITAKLLAGSFWQPLYSSLTSMESEEYGEVADNVVYDKTGEYSLHSYSLPEKAGEIAEKVKELAPDLEAGPVTIYANPAFIRYLTGEDHQ